MKKGLRELVMGGVITYSSVWILEWYVYMYQWTCQPYGIMYMPPSDLIVSFPKPVKPNTQTHSSITH